MICYMTEERVQLMRDRLASLDANLQQHDEGSGRWAELAELRERAQGRIERAEKLLVLVERIEGHKDTVKVLSVAYRQTDI